MFLEILLVATSAVAQENTMPIPDSERPQVERPYNLDFELEVRAQRDQRDRPQNRSSDSIHEISFGGRYRFDERVAVELDLAVEQLNGDSTFFAKEALIQWTPWIGVAELDLGQQFLPVGLINERDNFFSSNPPYMQKLLAESKGIDLGATARVFPLRNRWAYLEGGVYSGRFVRAGDARYEDPQSAPRLASLKSSSAFHDAFATYFEHDLAIYDPVKAYGAGFELRSPEWNRFRLSVLSEYWSFDQLQRQGPDQRMRALLLYGDLRWWKLAGGYRWSEARGEIVSALGGADLPVETSKLGFLGVHVNDVFSMRVERVIETQSETLRDEYVGRALVRWNM